MSATETVAEIEAGPPPALSGRVTLATLVEVRAAIARSQSGGPVDLSAVTRLDTAGAWLLVSSGRPLRGANDAQGLLLRTVQDALPTGGARPSRAVHHRAGDWLEQVGMAVGAVFSATGRSLGFVGLVMAGLARLLLHPRRLRPTALVHRMQEVGLNAVPIVALMGFLIGVVLAFQGRSVAFHDQGRACGTGRFRPSLSGPERSAPEMRGPPSLARQAAPVVTSDAGGHARAWVAASSSLLVSASFFAVCAFSAAR